MYFLVLFCSGAVFFAIWVVMFLVSGNASLLVADRGRMAEAYASGAYGLWTWTAAQILASLPYLVLASVVFQLPFFFLTNINMSTEVFFFGVVLNVVLQLFMEAVVWVIVEIVQNSMMAVTLSVTTMGRLRARGSAREGKGTAQKTAFCF